MQDERLIYLKREQDASRSVGRPLRNPFHHRETEEDFCRRARIVVERYYDSSPENTKKPFVLPGGVRMGKTTFWAFIFYFYTKKYPESAEKLFCPIFPELEHPLMDNNLDHFLQILKRLHTTGAVGDRPATLKVVKALEEMRGLGSLHDLSQYSQGCQRNLEKYRHLYQTVLKCWLEAE